MKKYLLSLLITAALITSFIVPTLGDGETEDNFKGDASIFLTDASGNKIPGQSRNLTDFLVNGYLYLNTKVTIESENRSSGTENLKLEAVEGSSLDNIESVEYSEKGSAWADAYGYIINTDKEFTNKHSIERDYRIKINGDVSFCLKYTVDVPDANQYYESYPRYVFVDGGNSLTYFVKPEPSSEPTSEVSSEVSTEATSEVTTEPTTAPTTKPTTAPTSVVPSTDPTTVAPSTAPTTVEPSTEAPTGDVTTVAPTKAPKVVAPGKVKIKKVWKKKLSAKKLKIKLGKVKNAKGYQVCVYKNKKNAKKHIKAIVTKYTTKLKYTIKSKKLKNKKKLFVGARAYNASSDAIKVFGPWAKIKKVKVK